MTEENITLTLIEWLTKKGWEIICFDFPQSGTGVSLHPNEEIRSTRNKGDIIPDIIAINGMSVVFFENKYRFEFSDFEKVDDLRNTSNYSNAIKELLDGFEYSNIYYGVGLPFSHTNSAKSEQNKNKTDFILLLDSNNEVIILHDPNELF